MPPEVAQKHREGVKSREPGGPDLLQIPTWLCATETSCVRAHWCSPNHLISRIQRVPPNATHSGTNTLTFRGQRKGGAKTTNHISIHLYESPLPVFKTPDCHPNIWFMVSELIHNLVTNFNNENLIGWKWCHEPLWSYLAYWWRKPD